MVPRPLQKSDVYNNKNESKKIPRERIILKLHKIKPSHYRISFSFIKLVFHVYFSFVKVFNTKKESNTAVKMVHCRWAWKVCSNAVCKKNKCIMLIIFRVKLWGTKFGTELWESLTRATRRDEIQKVWTQELCSQKRRVHTF